MYDLLKNYKAMDEYKSSYRRRETENKTRNMVNSIDVLITSETKEKCIKIFRFYYSK